jgi:protein-S-isoprenylcysteine O-methyltransferase Ste14
VPTVRTIAWIAAIVYSTVPSYWLWVHSRAPDWAQRGGKRLHAVGPAWVLMWVAAAALTWNLRSKALYTAVWPWAPAGLLIFTGIILYGFSRQSFSTDQVLGRAELQPHKHEQRLAVGGIRKRIRHPLYLGHFCELLGWSIGSGLLVCYVLLIFAGVTGYVMIRAEERELEQRFGEAYRAYRQRSAAMIPGLW